MISWRCCKITVILGSSQVKNMATSQNDADSPQTAATPALNPGLLALRREIAAYRRELPRLLSQGHEGRFVLIQGDLVIGLWDTFDEAYQAGRERFGLGAFLAQPVDARDLTRAFPPELEQSEAN
jgi:hypothetical protein